MHTVGAHDLEYGLCNVTEASYKLFTGPIKDGYSPTQKTPTFQSLSCSALATETLKSCGLQAVYNWLQFCYQAHIDVLTLMGNN